MRSAIIGVSGPRARAHAGAYRNLEEASLVGVSARTPGAATSFAAGHLGAAAFTDHRDMLDATRPDIVHVNTPPSARIDILRDCESAGVASVVLEKPVAVDRPDLEVLRRFAATTSMRVVVNHQIHYHRAMRRLRERVRESRTGRLEIDGSAAMNAAYQGTHVMQSARALLPTEVSGVTATASGTRGLKHSTAAHYAPDDLDASYETADGRIRLRCGTSAPRVADVRAEPVWANKRIKAVVDGDEFEWTMWSLSMRVDGRTEVVDLDWKREDAHAQRELTKSVVDRDMRAPHPLSLAGALDDYALILDAYMVAAHAKAPGGSEVGVLTLLEAALESSSESPRGRRRLHDTVSED